MQTHAGSAVNAEACALVAREQRLLRRAYSAPSYALRSRELPTLHVSNRSEAHSRLQAVLRPRAHHPTLLTGSRATCPQATSRPGPRPCQVACSLRLRRRHGQT